MRRCPKRRRSRFAAIASRRSAPTTASSHTSGPSTQVIDLRGQLAIPGLIESHGHFMGFGQSKMTLDLMDVKDWNEIVSMVAAAAKQAQARRVDPRARLAPGKVVERAEAERRRLSVSRRAEQGVAEQPGDADARQRSRELRQRQGDGAGGHHARRRRIQRAARF